MVDFSCDVSTCSRIAESGIYCNTHSTMIKRHGVPEPEFMCRACGSKYLFRGKMLDSANYCGTCHLIYKELQSQSASGCQSCNKMLGFYENHIGNLKIKVFDDYLSQSPFIFGFNVETGELVNTVKFRDPNWDADKVKGK